MLSAAENLFATLFPGDCRICNAPLVNISRLPVCSECLSAMLPISVGTCAVCGERLLSPYVVSTAPSEPKCALCRRLAPPFARAVAYGSYEGGLRELLHLLKYEQVRPAAYVLGRMLRQAIAGLEFTDSAVLVVPVPLHRDKLHHRGFNQSDLLASAALKDQKTEFVLESGLLKRVLATQSQTGLTRHQRRENIRGSFSVMRPEVVAGREILLVDDVFTTGTTVSECARILLRAGASKVYVATVARTLKADAQPFQLVREGAGVLAAAVNA
jgi:ComF family protein